MDENITIDSLAEQLGLNKFHFIKKFKTATDMTPYQFIIKKKLERSKSLLKLDNLSLTDITFMLNFSDQSHFSNSIKKMYGMSPNAFRKSLKRV